MNETNKKKLVAITTVLIVIVLIMWGCISWIPGLWGYLVAAVAGGYGIWTVWPSVKV